MTVTDYRGGRPTAYSPCCYCAGLIPGAKYANYGGQLRAVGVFIFY